MTRLPKHLRVRNFQLSEEIPSQFLPICAYHGPQFVTESKDISFLFVEKIIPMSQEFRVFVDEMASLLIKPLSEST